MLKSLFNHLITTRRNSGLLLVAEAEKNRSFTVFNTLRPRQNGRRFADDTFKRIFLNENVRISIKISMKFVFKDPIDNNPALVQIMAWCRSGDKPSSEPMMVSLLTHICVTRPQWVKSIAIGTVNISGPRAALQRRRQKCGSLTSRVGYRFLPEPCAPLAPPCGHYSKATS